MTLEELEAIRARQQAALPENWGTPGKGGPTQRTIWSQNDVAALLAENERLRSLVPRLEWRIGRVEATLHARTCFGVTLAATARWVDGVWICWVESGECDNDACCPDLKAARDAIIAALPEEWRSLVPEIPLEKA